MSFGQVLIAIGVVLITAVIVRRLVGIDHGRWPSTWLAVVLGLAATLALLVSVAGDLMALGWNWLPLGCALVAGFSLLAAAVIELLGSPNRQPRAFRIPRPVAAIRLRVGRSLRYLAVMRIALQEGLLVSALGDEDDAGTRLGRSLAATFERAGGLFVKLGQAMASQPQLIDPAVATELGRLQNQVAPTNAETTMRVLQEEIGSPDRVFAEFQPDPVAAASIGQTYFATLLDGREVVVKVQRPGVRESMERDLDILVRLSELLDRRTGWARAIGLKELTAGFVESTREELDFRIEAENGRVARDALTPGDSTRIPEILDEFTTRRVLVQERVDGRSVGAAGALAGLTAEHRRSLADSLLSLLIRQMVSGGRFHADPHPGNVFITRDGALALIDFGAVGRLNRFERAGLTDIFRGLQTDDPTLLREATLRIGRPSGRIDTDALDREFARFLARAIEPDGTLNAASLGDLLVVCRDFGIVLPRSTAGLFRTLLTAVGTLELLSPRYDFVSGVKRSGGDVASPLGATRTIRDFLQREVLNSAPVLARLPRDVDDVLRSLARGDLRVRVSLLSEPEDVEVVRGLMNVFVAGLISSALAIASAILLSIPTLPGQPLGIANVVGGVGLFFSSLLMLRVVLQILRRRR